METITTAKQIIISSKEILISELNNLGAYNHPKIKDKFNCPICNSKDNLCIYEINGKWKTDCKTGCNDFKTDTIIGAISKLNNISINQAIKDISSRNGIMIKDAEYTAEEKKEYAKKKTEEKAKKIAEQKEQEIIEKARIEALSLYEEGKEGTEEYYEKMAVLEFGIDEEVKAEIKEEAKYEAIGKKKLNILTTVDYIDKGLGDEKGWIIEGLAYEKSIGFVIAPPKVGKTIFSYNMAYHIAEGKDFINHKIDRPYKSLYILLEGTAGNLINTYGKSENLFILEEKNFDWEDYRTQIIEVIKHHGIEVVFIDSFYRMTDRNMSKSEFIKPILKDLDTLSTELKCTFIMPHHTNRVEITDNHQNKVAGSSDIVRVGEFFIYLEKPKKTEEEEEAEYNMSIDELNKLPLKMILNKNDYRYGKQGFTKYSLEINTVNGVISSERYKIEGKRVSTDYRAEDLIRYAESIIPNMDKITRELLCKEISKVYDKISLSSITRNYGTILIDNLVKRNLIKKVNKHYIYIGKEFTTIDGEKWENIEFN